MVSPYLAYKHLSRGVDPGRSLRFSQSRGTTSGIASPCQAQRPRAAPWLTSCPVA